MAKASYDALTRKQRKWDLHWALVDIRGGRWRAPALRRLRKAIDAALEHRDVAVPIEAGGRGIFTHFVASVEPAEYRYVETAPIVVEQRIPKPMKCVVCGGTFKTKRAHAETCSPKCRQRKRRAKP